MINVAPVHLGTDPFFWNVWLAMEEFAANRGGLPVGGVTRPLIVLVCSADPGYWDVMDLGMDHLIDTVRVPGIFMVNDWYDLRHATERAFVERGQDVLLLHKGGSWQELDAVHAGRVRHMLASHSRISDVFRPLLERVEQHVNPGRPRPTRLLVHPTANDDRLLESLRINGAPVLDQLDENVFVFQLGASIDFAALEPDIVLQGFWGVRPTTIDSAARAGSVRPPFHVFVGDTFGMVDEELRTALDQDPTLRTRVLGVRTEGAVDRSTRAGYLVRSGAFTPVEMKIEDTEYLYDLSYLMFYAAAAAPAEDGVITARGLRDGFERLLGGDRYDVGPRDIDAILSHLEVVRTPRSACTAPWATPISIRTPASA